MTQQKTIVLFDGVCHLCQWSVRFIIRRDPQARFQFAPIQSPLGARLLQRCGMPSDCMESFVLVQGERCRTKSDAALAIAAQLSGLWPAFSVLRLVPLALRDWIYDSIARRRYRWFGKDEQCMLPAPEHAGRFLHDSDSSKAAATQSED